MSVSTIAKNTAYLTAATVFQKLLALVYFILIANAFSNADIGEYTNAIYLATLFGIFVELGLNSVLTRDVAREPEKAENFLRNIIGLKLIAAVVAYAALFFYVRIFHYPPEAQMFTLLTGIIMVLDAIQTSAYAFLRGREQFRYEALGIIGSQILLVACGFLVIWLGLPVFFLFFALLSSSLLHLFWGYFVLQIKFKISLWPLWQKTAFQNLFAIGMPFFLYALFARFYGYIDTVILYKLTNSIDVSYYTAAYKIPFALTFIPAAFGSALYPAFSRYAHEKKMNELQNVAWGSVYFLCIISIPLAAGGYVLAPELIYFVYGSKYAPAGYLLQILMLSVPFIFASYPFGALMNAANRQRKNTWIMASAFLLNFGMNLFLIPYFFGAGSSLAMLASSALLFFAPAWYCRDMAKFDAKIFFLGLAKIFFSAGLMSFAVVQVQEKFPLPVSILAGVLVYGVSLVMCRAVTAEQIRQIKGILNRQQNV